MATAKDDSEPEFVPHDDPRKFRFAIICLNCQFRTNTLQNMRQHSVKNCLKGPPYKLLCGHCEWETSSWPKLAHHLNKSELHMAKACHLKYDFNEPTVSTYCSGTESTPRKIVTKSNEPATVVSRDFELRTPSDVEPSNTPPVRPSIIETPPLLKEGALDILESAPPKVTPLLPNVPPQLLHFRSVPSKSTSTVALDTIVPPPFTVVARIRQVSILYTVHHRNSAVYFI